jgi:N-acetylneuraminate epimerase
MIRWVWIVILLPMLGCAHRSAVATPMPTLPDAEGFAGGFAGASHGVLLFAGGSNFPDRKPWEGGEKHFYDTLFSLQSDRWSQAGALPSPTAYGASVTYNDAMICIGGGKGRENFLTVTRWEWINGKPHSSPLPSLPVPLSNECAAVVNDKLYVACGQIRADVRAERALYRLDLATPNAQWETLQPLPGRERILATSASCDGAFWVIGGVTLDQDPTGKLVRQYLSDAYRYDPAKGWTRVADLPIPMAASPSPAPAANHQLFLLGGDDGSAINLSPLNHPGFNRRVLRFDVRKNQWTYAGTLPVAQVTTPTVPMGKDWVIPGGEIHPGTRTNKVWKIQLP